MRVLLVENDPIIGYNGAAELERAGHEVLGPACSEQEAEDLARSGQPDLALVDINLDGDHEGVRLARTLGREMRLPCLFVSGLASTARANRDAAIGVLVKPFDCLDLTRSVEVAGALSRGEPAGRTPRGLELFHAA